MSATLRASPNVWPIASVSGATASGWSGCEMAVVRNSIVPPGNKPEMSPTMSSWAVMPRRALVNSKCVSTSLPAIATFRTDSISRSPSSSATAAKNNSARSTLPSTIPLPGPFAGSGSIVVRVTAGVSNTLPVISRSRKPICADAEIFSPVIVTALLAICSPAGT